MNRPATTIAEATSPATSAATLWGSVLPIPAGGGAGDDFEARVRRAWEHLKASYFTFEEQDRLREELGRLIAKEGTSE